MSKGWGSLIFALISIVTLGGTASAQDEDLTVSIDWADVPPLLITDESYDPPNWLACQPVEVASVSPSMASGCANEPEAAAGTAQVVVYEEKHLKFLQWVNTRVNDAIGSNTSIDYMIKAAEAKRRIIERVEEIGMSKWPPTSLLYAVTDLPVEGSEEGEVDHIPHLTLIVRFDKGDLVLDARHSYVMPWSCFPGRFEGIQSPWWTGKWLAVNDDRHEPEESAMECACSLIDCPIE